jgi:hypothetical protein
VPSGAVQAQRSAGYLQTWGQWQASANPVLRARHRRLCRRFGAPAARFGYDMRALDARTPLPVGIG